MKNIFLFACIFLFSFPVCTFGQQISETNLLLGISKPFSLVQDSRWEESSPTYLFVGGTKSWYSNDQRVSLRKEVGFNLQYANMNLSNGGLGGGNHYTGNMVSLFADAALLVRFRISKSFALGMGPAAEILVLGKYNLNNSYYSRLNYPKPTSGEIQTKGFNRDYFNKPSYGIKFSLFESMVDARTSIGLNFSYLWTQSESSNFYASNYARISFVIGFKKQKKELPPDLLN